MRKNKSLKPAAVENQTIKFNTVNINKIADTSGAPERIAVSNWFSGQIEETKISVCQRHAHLITEKQSAGEHVTDEMSYALFLSAVKMVRREEEKLSYKRSVSAVEAEELASKRIKGFRQPKRTKGAAKYGQIKIKYLGVITKLLSESYSWSEVAQYLHTYYGFACTRAYIRQGFIKAMAEIGVKDENKLS